MSDIESTVMGPSVGYIDLLDFHLENKLKKEAEGPRRFNPLRPSSAGKCTKELAYELAEFKGAASYEKEGMKADTHRLLNLGHSIEWNILKMFEDVEMFETRYRQQIVSFFKLDTGKWIEGSIDAVFWSDTHKAVIDIKSKGNKYSGWSRTQWDEHTEKYSNMKSVYKMTDRCFWIDDLEAFLEEVNDPFLASNFYQLNLYANTDFLVERGVDHASIIQYAKDTSRLRELRFRPSVAVYEQIRNKFTRANGALRPEDIPRDYALGSIKCAFCSYNKHCWPEANALKEYFATWPKKKWPTNTSELGLIGDQLEVLFEKYTDVEDSIKELDRVEKLITLVMNENQIQKVRLNDDRVYEMKALKGDGLVIRKAKV